MAQAHDIVVLVPMSPEQAAALVTQGHLPGPLPAVTANAALCETFDTEPGSEAAEFAAFQVACVMALAGGADHVVVSAQAGAAQQPGPAAHDGEVVLDGLPLRDAGAFFTHENPGAAEQASQAAHGLSPDEAWELPLVQSELAEHPMLWHDVSELARHIAVEDA